MDKQISRSGPLFDLQMQLEVPSGYVQWCSEARTSCVQPHWASVSHPDATGKHLWLYLRGQVGPSTAGLEQAVSQICKVLNLRI